jgi:hypothetical protein
MFLCISPSANVTRRHQPGRKALTQRGETRMENLPKAQKIKKNWLLP